MPAHEPNDEQTLDTPRSSPGSEPGDQTRVRPADTAAGRPDGTPVVAGYELAREIARGGMGAVYFARDLALDREVAVKVMLPGMNAAEFVRESQIAAKLPHPGIPPVHALGTLPDGRPFLAMKLIQGETLDKLLRERADPSAERGRFVAAFEQMCQAVGYAHAQGIVHRDLKPANVMVGAFGEVQVMDWGLAKVVGSADGIAAGGTVTVSEDVAATVAGTVKGTPAYMAPEQARGEPVDARADVFALGGILAAVLTGKPPFAGNSVLDTIIRAAKAELDDVFARLDGCGADEELVAVARRCLSPRAEDRPATGEDVASAVSAYRAGVDARLHQAEQDRAAATAKAEEQRKRRRVQLALAGVVAATLAGAGIATALVIEKQAADKQKQAEERFAAEQKRQADLRAADVAALAEKRQARAGALVQALESASTAEVPRLVEDLKEFRDLTGARLREQAARPVSEKSGLHARLVLLSDDPAQVGALAEYVPACRPDELLTLRDALMPHAAAVSVGLWAVVADPKAEDGKRARAAGALAALAPDDARWPTVAPAVAGAALSGTPTEFVTSQGALEPVGGFLVPVLLARYPKVRREIEGGKLDVPKLVEKATRYDRTANLLARYATRSADLAELALVADPRHYPLFAPALRARKAEVVPVLKAQLTRSVAADWKDAPLKPEWAAVDPATMKSVAAADGLVHERFALVQAVPLAEFEALANTLGRSGYRPTRVRPYADGGKVLVAAVWARDGIEWKLLTGATADAVRARDAELRRGGFEPVDVAAWAEPGARAVPVDALAAAAGGPGAVSVPPLRFAAVWRAATDAKPVSRMYLGVPYSAHKDATDVLKAGQLGPLGVQAVLVPGEARARYSGVWGAAPSEWNVGWGRTPESYSAGSDGQPCADAALLRDGQQKPEFAAVWHGGLSVDVEQPTRLSAAEQLVKAKELAAAGWRPVGLSVADAQLACSVWHRPLVADAALEEFGKRRGYAAAVLVSLGEAEAVWPVFAFPTDGDPTARSYLQERLAQVGADPLTLMARFEAEADVSAKRALVVALGDFPLDVVPGAEREALAAKLLVQYREHPDSGLHGALDWLLRQKWGKGKELAAIDADLAREARGRVAVRVLAGAGVPVGLPSGLVGPQLPAPAVAKTRDWFVNGEGQTFAVVRGPVEFTLGSPPSEPGRFTNEVPHQKRISRTFAIATKEVTVAQFTREFRPNHSWTKRYSPDQDTPIVAVTWYDCAAYCNWLSAREGIPEDQWCYVESKDGVYGEGMSMKAGHLNLTGYRLPTEAEWEYACRSGAGTARYYGRGEGLLPRYGWFLNTADERSWPVGQLRPNDRGLFDALGNALEWCEDPFFTYQTAQVEDIENRKFIQISEQIDRLLRGGSFVLQPVYLRSAYRLSYRPGYRTSTVGFRPVRTLLN